jgi:hypothetical protein
MKRKLRNSAWLAGGLLLACVVCRAQYRATATMDLNAVEKAGFYKIVLPPAFVAQCRDDLSDIRMIDQSGQETPYVLRVDTDVTSTERLIAIPDPKISRQDSNRHSYYRLQYDDFYRIRRLSFVITHPKLYKRSVSIEVADPKDFGVMASSSIDPADTVIWGQAVKARCLLVDIANEDDVPLEISRVATAQSGIYLLTLLQPGHFMLVAGDSAVRAPKYDLRYFTDSLGVPAVIGVGPMRKENRAMLVSLPETKKDKKDGRSAGPFLWGLVTLILLLLIYVSVKLARAVNKKEKDDHL